MSKGSSACVVGLACGRMTLKHSRTGQNLTFVYSLRSIYGSHLLLNNPSYIPELAISCQLGHGSSYSSSFLSTQSQASSSRSPFLYGPSLQRGRQPEHKVETIEEIVESTSQEETKVAADVMNIEVPTKAVKGAVQNNTDSEGAATGALDKIHKAWETGTWGEEKLGKWARKKLELGVGWRVKAALAEFSTLKKVTEQKEVIINESNLLNARELIEKLVKEDGRTKKFLKGADLDRESFTRIFDLSALRVPADECGNFVSKLKGHLLNWPRVKNVARVEGDDVDPAMRSLLWEGTQPLKTPECLVESVRSAVYSSNLVDFRGNMKNVKQRKFLNLEDTRNSLGQLQSARGGVPSPRVVVRGSSRRAWDEAAVTIKVVEATKSLETVDTESEAGELERLVKSTRLLLLDERHAGKPVEELPQAVQMVLEKDGCEVVQCRLSLAYDYWPMDEVLREVLPAGITIPTAYETVGHIAHLNLRNEHLPYRYTIAQIVLEKNKPRIRTVVNKTDVIHNKYRTMQLELLAGNSSLVTTLVEHGLSFRVDLAAVYWNSRLATERQRLIANFDKNDIVCDVFAGVGPIAVAAANKVKFVYANDLNPTAVVYLQHNLALNKLAHKAEVCNDDGREFVRDLLRRERPVSFSQVVMNLPLDAAEFLDVFKGAFSRETWERRALPNIHVYGFSKAADPEAEYAEKSDSCWIVSYEMPSLVRQFSNSTISPMRTSHTARQRIADILTKMPHPMHIHRVRLVAPGKWMLCASFRLPAVVAFGTQSSTREFA